MCCRDGFRVLTPFFVPNLTGTFSVLIGGAVLIGPIGGGLLVAVVLSYGRENVKVPPIDISDADMKSNEWL